jgi:hypothetical protein
VSFRGAARSQVLRWLRKLAGVGEPGTHNPRPVLMDSGSRPPSSASPRNDGAYDSNFGNAAPGQTQSLARFPYQANLSRNNIDLLKLRPPARVVLL